jgi:ribosomal protein L6P/L9E
MTKNELQKKVKLLNTLSFAKINNQSFILFKYKENSINYLHIPSFLKCELKNKILTFSNKELTQLQLIEYNQFFSQLQDFSKRLEKPFKKRLLLKGLGYKAALKTENSLELKIGFSHSVSIVFDKETIKVTLDKNILMVEGFDKTKVGNFVNKIRTLKLPDSYKGKGFWYKNEVIKLKEINKT